MATIRKALVATDFSECSDQALEMAIDLVRRENAKLTVLHVCQMPAYLHATVGGMVAPSPELIADFVEEAQRRLAEVKQRLAGRGIAVETSYIEGEPRDVIPRFAAERGYDLIVVGSHGRRGLQRFFLGSVAEHVVRAATVPVLVVHPSVTPAAGAGAA